ncbi:MAG: hypothetical protein IT218_02605 [Ignavibacteria bacterium]|nr:hypothetical protein [Ignavibacteria bacterium]
MRVRTIASGIVLSIAALSIITAAQLGPVAEIKAALKEMESIVRRGRPGCGHIEAIMVARARNGKTDTNRLSITTAGNVIEVVSKGSLLRSDQKRMISVYDAPRRIIIGTSATDAQSAETATMLTGIVDTLMSKCVVKSVTPKGSHVSVVMVPNLGKEERRTIDYMEFVLDTTTSMMQEITMVYVATEQMKSTYLRYVKVVRDQPVPDRLKAGIEEGILDRSGKPTGKYSDYLVQRR